MIKQTKTTPEVPYMKCSIMASDSAAPMVWTDATKNDERVSD
jgi:hypothetical protein